VVYPLDLNWFAGMVNKNQRKETARHEYFFPL